VSESVLGGRYRVEARIGSGGMAEVFRGVDTVLDRTVAIKVLLPQFARDAGFVARFSREAQAAARLNHPDIVGVYDTGTDGDTKFIVMEFIEGRTLADFLATGGKPSTNQAVDLAQRVAQALSAAHAQGIVHRDIKPANVMVTRDGSLKVMDFGIARMSTDITAPQTSSVLGTPTYLSPEQAQGQPVDARSDIYSLGILLYELLVGRPPFTGDSPVAIAYKQVNEAPIPPSQLNADVPASLDAVVMKALAKNPANRYQTAESFYEDLERVKRGQHVEATPLLPAGAEATQVISRPQATQVLPPQEEQPGSGRKVWLGVLIGILVVGILGAGGYFLANALNDSGGDSVPMPNVVGKQYEEAVSELNDAGFFNIDRKNQESDKPEGEVLAQSKEQGTLVSTDETIRLTVAVPIKQFPVPDLKCKTVEEATALLTDAHLTLGTQTPVTSNDCEGQPNMIVSQDVIPDTSVPRDTPINVEVSTGPASLTVPDVTCTPIGAARSQLINAGFTNIQTGDQVESLPQCPNPVNVALQEPAAGTEASPDTPIILHQGGLAPSESPSSSP
jgi:beta-lactam-binding protein with PASTA domain/predicted Ser/Thr protein kinase